MCHESCYTPDATFTSYDTFTLYDDLQTVIYYPAPDSGFIDKEDSTQKAIIKVEEFNSNSSTVVSSSTSSTTELIDELI